MEQTFHSLECTKFTNMKHKCIYLQFFLIYARKVEKGIKLRSGAFQLCTSKIIKDYIWNKKIWTLVYRSSTLQGRHQTKIS